MEAKVLGMDWYNMFECAGGACTLTCCAANWIIRLTDEEIKIYQDMEHPFRDSILEQIDVEKKLLKGRGRHCALLNDEGWCRLILECGEEYLSGTCKLFPRCTAAYGDIIERTVGIECPVVAGYLFRDDSIEFDFGVCEIDEAGNAIDFDLYDGLSYIRTYLIETYQKYGRSQPAAVAFLLIVCMIQIKSAFEIGEYSKAWAVQFADESFSEKVFESFFSREEALTKKYFAKAEIISSIWNDLEGWLRGKLDKYIPELPFGDWDFLWRLLGDAEAFAGAIERFAVEFREKYRMVYENYFVYALFKSFIVTDSENFAKRMVDHFLEYMFFQSLAAAVYEHTGELSQDIYALLITIVSREIENRVDNLDVFLLLLEAKGLLTPDGLLSLLIF